MHTTLAPTAIAAPAIYAAGRRDMTCRQLALLHAIAEKPGFSNKQYAEKLGLRGPDVTRACDALLLRGYAHRERDIKDGRSVRLFITSAGRDLLEGRAS